MTNLVAWPAIVERLQRVISDHRRVAVTGETGAGKTALVAKLVRETPFDTVFWLTFRSGINVTLARFLLEIAGVITIGATITHVPVVEVPPLFSQPPEPRYDGQA